MYVHVSFSLTELVKVTTAFGQFKVKMFLVLKASWPNIVFLVSLV